jgi:hypothetical protein
MTILLEPFHGHFDLITKYYKLFLGILVITLPLIVYS